MPHRAPAPASLDEDRLIADLHWLIHDGYVIEFSDGRLWAMPDQPPPPPPPAPKKSPSHPKAAAEPVAAASETVSPDHATDETSTAQLASPAAVEELGLS